MTHILIPIKDIDFAINLCKGEVQRYTDMGNETKYLVYKYAYEKYLNLLEDFKINKQISLDEKDIEKKALIYSRKEYGIPKDWNLNEFTDKQLESNIISTYSQALLDLL
jgi:hypothetical protein